MDINQCLILYLNVILPNRFLTLINVLFVTKSNYTHHVHKYAGYEGYMNP